MVTDQIGEGAVEVDGSVDGGTKSVGGGGGGGGEGGWPYGNAATAATRNITTPNASLLTMPTRRPLAAPTPTRTECRQSLSVNSITAAPMNAPRHAPITCATTKMGMTERKI